MQLHEFDRLMIEQGGWTFPAEYYEEIIEPVYLELNEDKVEFVKFCHAKDLNGLELLKNYLPTVKKLAETGMNVFQIHTAIYLLAEKDYLIRELINMNKGLINKIVEQQEAIKKASSKKSEKTLARKPLPSSGRSRPRSSNSARSRGSSRTPGTSIQARRSTTRPARPATSRFTSTSARW